MRTATPVFAPVLKLTLLGASCLAISFAQASNELQLSRDLAAANQEAAKADDDPIFAIRGFRHQGNTLLDTLEIETILQRYTGKEGNFSKIQAAVSALEKRYLLAGYGAVKVILPAQEIDDGIVDIRIVEGKIGKITVTGAQHFTPENIRASLPMLSEGQQPNMRAINAALRLANDNPSKGTQLIFRQGSAPGEVDAQLKVVDDSPWRVALLADNSGAPDSNGHYATGRYRTGVVLQHNNLFERDHSATLQYVTSPDHISQVSIFGLGYRIPLYALGDAIELSAGYSNVNSGTLETAAGQVGISGKGQIASVRYEHMLPRWDEWQHKVTGGLEYRAYTNNVNFTGAPGSLVPDVTTHPLAFAYRGNTRLGALDLNLGLDYLHNLPGGDNGKDDSFRNTRSSADADFALYRYQMGLAFNLSGNWWLRTSLSGQYTRDALIPGEQFGVGGADSVRGFYERQIADDRGQRYGLELQTPDFGNYLNVPDLRVNALAFIDGARVDRNHVLASEKTHESIGSNGLGLRIGYTRHASLRLDWARVTQGGADRRAGDNRLHANLLLLF